jgi:hypothetical protein
VNRPSYSTRFESRGPLTVQPALVATAADSASNQIATSPTPIVFPDSLKLRKRETPTTPHTLAIKLDEENMLDSPYSDLSPELQEVAERLAQQGKSEVSSVFIKTLRDLKVKSQSLSPAKCLQDTEPSWGRHRDESGQLTPDFPTKISPPVSPSLQKPTKPASLDTSPTALPRAAGSSSKPSVTKTKATVKSHLVMSVDLPRGSRSKTRALEESQKRSRRSKRGI